MPVFDKKIFKFVVAEGANPPIFRKLTTKIQYFKENSPDTMRNVALFLLLCLPFVAFAQLSEDFSDGNFTQNPSWNGSTSLFLINGDNQLQLNASTSGTAYLSTPSAFRKGQTWEFWIKLGFNTSSQNYERVWLTLDNAIPDSATAGYFVNIGGTADKVSLYKKAGTTVSELIPGVDKELDKTSVTMQVKVEYSAEGIWKLFVRQDGDADYLLKGECQDADASGGDYFALQCIYTSSYAKKIWFDNLSVTQSQIKDVIAPTVKSLSVLNEKQLSILFSESVDASTAVFTAESLANPVISLSSDGRTLQLSYAGAFESGKQYSLLVTGVKDLSGNAMPAVNMPFIYWPTLENVKTGDLIISEIMANPSGIVGLPNVEYVELHNNTDKKANLLNWKFYYGDKSYVLPEYALLPDSNVIICASSNASLFSSAVNRLGFESFPALANSGKLLYIESPEGVVTSFADYTDKWYQDEFRANGGFSLECIDVTNLSGNSSNWRACQNAFGGSPGAKNSVSAINPDRVSPTLLHSSLKNPACITLSFSKAMDKTSATSLDNYSILSGNNSIVKAEISSPIPNTVWLYLSDSLRRSESLSIELSSKILCVSGNSLSGKLIVRTAIPDSLEVNDIIINEILFNPHPNGVDYVELFNRSGKNIDLAQMQLTSRKSDGTLQVGIRLATESTPVFPSEYVILTTDKSAVCSFYGCKSSSSFIELASLPSMPDDAGNIQLVNASAKVIDGITYSEKMHHPFVKNPEGVALERVNAERPSSDPGNWQSAASVAGFGTPGYQNSQQFIVTTDKKGFWLENETVTPDNNGKEDLLRINYRFDESGFTANLRIYDRSGRLVNQIAANAILGTEGLLTWDATDTVHQMVRPGIYILFIEYYKSDRSPVRQKIPVVVGN